MNRTDAPKKQPVAFGVNGQRENLPDTTPSGDNTASYDAGFPAVTMILKSAGGLPPKGRDMNQILFELSAIGRWLSAGALNAYDSAFATTIGGYPQASVLVGNDGTTIYISTVDANTNDPNTTTTGWLSLSKITAIAALSGGANKIPYFSGANTAAQTDFTSVGRDVVGQTSVANLVSYLGLSGASSIRTAVFSSSGSWTCPTGITSILVDAAAGGGGGAYGGSGAFGGGGGGGGASVIGSAITVNPGQVYTITIGSGGVGGTSATNDGSAGGATSLGTLVTLSGGGAGIRVSGTGGAAGGAGGVDGQTGTNYASPSISFGGAGGGALFGAGGAGGNVARAGVNAGGFGGGGGGGGSGGNGGAGSNGFIRITW